MEHPGSSPIFLVQYFPVLNVLMPISFEDFPAIAMFDDTLAASSTCFAVRARGRPHAPRAFPAGLEVSSSTAYKRPWEMMWLRRVLMSCLDTTWYNVIQADTDPEGSATFLDSAHESKFLRSSQRSLGHFTMILVSLAIAMVAGLPWPPWYAMTCHDLPEPRLCFEFGLELDDVTSQKAMAAWPLNSDTNSPGKHSTHRRG